MVKGAKGSLHAVGLWPVTGDGMTTLRCKIDDCYGVLHLLVARVSYNKVGAGDLEQKFLCENLVGDGKIHSSKSV